MVRAACLLANRPRPLVVALRHGRKPQHHQVCPDAIDVTRQTVIAIELGKYSPSLESAFRISRVFGVGLEDVFGWEG